MGVRHSILLLVIVVKTVMVDGQQNLTLFLMHDVPQASFVNPAVTANCPIIIGVPGLSSIHANYSNTAFSVNKLFVQQNDSLYFAPGKAIEQMKGKELISSEIYYAPLYIGLWIKSAYWTFSVTEKVMTYNTLNQNVVQLLWQGNYPAFTGSPASLNGVRVNAVHYREFALGWAKAINNKLQFGIRGKLLFGKGSVYTLRTKGSFYTNPDNFALDLNLNTDVRTSFPLDVSTDNEGYVTDIALQDDIDWKDYMLNNKNLGIGFDFGMIYQYSDRITLSASLLDIGAISWHSNVNIFESDGSFQYTGTSNSDFNKPDYIENLGDSLQNLFTPKPVSSGYTSPLLPQLYLGASYTINKHLNGGVVLRNEMLRNKIHPSLTLSANTYNYKVLNASVSYTAINGDFFNIGAGLGAQLGAFHVHAVSDDIFSFFNLSGSRNLNLRFGLSIVLGCSSFDKTKVSHKGISALPCYFSPYKK